MAGHLGPLRRHRHRVPRRARRRVRPASPWTSTSRPFGGGVVHGRRPSTPPTPSDILNERRRGQRSPPRPALERWPPRGEGVTIALIREETYFRAGTRRARRLLPSPREWGRARSLQRGAGRPSHGLAAPSRLALSARCRATGQSHPLRASIARPRRDGGGAPWRRSNRRPGPRVRSARTPDLLVSSGCCLARTGGAQMVTRPPFAGWLPPVAFRTSGPTPRRLRRSVRATAALYSGLLSTAAPVLGGRPYFAIERSPGNADGRGRARSAPPGRATGAAQAFIAAATPSAASRRLYAPLRSGLRVVAGVATPVGGALHPPGGGRTVDGDGMLDAACSAATTVAARSPVLS